MNSIRSKILQNIRRAGIPRTTAVLPTDARVIQPTLLEEPVSRFQRQLEKVAGSMTTVSSSAAVPPAVMNFLQQRELPYAVVMDHHLKSLSWPAALTLAYRTATAADRISVSQAVLGVAETGSVVLLSSPESPTTLNFLPEVQIVILFQERLVLHLEAVWKPLRSSSTLLPRTVNIITGPSRTADIEQTIQLGAHGPRMLHVIYCAS